jgi:hypothetical protein
LEKLKNITKKSLFLEMSVKELSSLKTNNHGMYDITNLSNTNTEYICTQSKCKEFDKNISFTDIYVLKEINMCVLNSNYGSIKILQFDEFCNYEVIYDCSYSSHLIEISSLKSQYDNKEDLRNLFLLDESMRFIDKYEFLACFLIDREELLIKNTNRNISLNEMVSDSISNKFIILFYNFGIIILDVQIDNMTNFSQLSFYQQISFENKSNKIKPKSFNIIEDSVILLQTEKDCIKLRFAKNKFILDLEASK